MVDKHQIFEEAHIRIYLSNIIPYYFYDIGLSLFQT